MMLDMAWTRSFLLLTAAVLGACSTTAPTLTRYDFGVPPAPAAGAAAVTPAAQGAAATVEISVGAPVWMDTPSVLYRLAYADESQLHAYAQVQWVAPPARLVEQALLAASAGGLPPACDAAPYTPTRVEVNLQEFSQDFDSPSASHVVLRAQVRVLAARTHAVLAQRPFDLRAAAPTPDGPGAVHGLRDLAHDFAGAALAWAAACPPDVTGKDVKR